MRRSQRLIAATVLIALSSALAGCSSSIYSWDPSDLLDFLDTKKKLPGERKPVFPEGVPGLEQGVPRQLYKGSAQEQIDQQNAQAAAAASAAPAAEVQRSHIKSHVNSHMESKIDSILDGKNNRQVVSYFDCNIDGYIDSDIGSQIDSYFDSQRYTDSHSHIDSFLTEIYLLYMVRGSSG